MLQTACQVRSRISALRNWHPRPFRRYGVAWSRRVPGGRVGLRASRWFAFSLTTLTVLLMLLRQCLAPQSGMCDERIHAIHEATDAALAAPAHHLRLRPCLC